MAIKLKHKMLIFWMIMLGFIAFGAWHSEDMETAYWAMWTVPIIFLFVWLLFDCIFVDDKAFIFDHDYEVPAQQLQPSYPPPAAVAAAASPRLLASLLSTAYPCVLS